MGKITRVRTGCWTCKKRHRKCDEARPFCNNCVKSNRKCEGYELRLLFDINGYSETKDDYSRKSSSKPKPKTRERIDGNSRLKVGKEADRPSGKSSSSNLEQFSTKLFEDLETLLNSPKPEPGMLPTNQPTVLADKRIIQSLHENDEKSLMKGSHSMDTDKVERFVTDSIKYSTLDNEIIDFIDKNKVLNLEEMEQYNYNFESSKTNPLSLTYTQENMMLRHFFKKLLPLLDAHPNSPWPDLALKYCDFDIARSCFISLACIHIYESRKGGSEYYQRGVDHINNTMNYLIRNISTNASESAGPEVGEFGIRSANGEVKQHTTSFVILVLINVHILFTVLEKGKSSMARFFFKVFASLCQNSKFYDGLMETDDKKSLICVLSWYDTVSAIVTPDCRLPYSNPEWYGSVSDHLSTMKMMACPGEIFEAMSKVCLLRHEIFKDIGQKLHNRNGRAQGRYFGDFESIKYDLLRYRDYVQLEGEEHDYYLRLRGAQCWSLAVYITLLRTIQPENYRNIIKLAVQEFIGVYGSMDPVSPVVTQMVWPVYAVGCECTTALERDSLRKFMKTLYQTAQMGTLDSLMQIVETVWERGISQEEVLQEWLEDGVDYLPL